MPTVRSVLCPVDFSEHSRRALAWARVLFPDARLIVLHAVDPLLAEAAKIRLGIDLTLAETEPALRQFVDATSTAGTMPKWKVALRIRVGRPADVILEIASAEATDVIVMGTHGLGGVRKWIVGSTTEHVLRGTATPVLAIPASRHESTSQVEAPSASSPQLILAATDFSDAARRAIDCAFALARDFSAALLLFHVVEPISVPPWLSADMSGADEERMASARAQLQQLTTQCSASTLCDTVITLGRPVDSIAEVAEHRHAGLIVMGVAGNSWFGARPGSIAYGVLSLASAPVLVVPPQPSPRIADQETS